MATTSNPYAKFRQNDGDSVTNPYAKFAPTASTPAAPAPEPTLKREPIRDFGRGIAAGVGTLVEGGGTLYGLATGDMDNAARRLGQDVRTHWEDAQSPALRRDKIRRSQAIDAADGQLAKAGTAISETLSNPALFADIVASNAASLIPGAAAGRIAQGVTLTRGLARGLAPGAAAARAGKVGTAAAVGTGAVQQGADVAGGAYDESLAKDEATWATNPVYQARVAAGEDPAAVRAELALAASRAALPGAAATSIASQFLPGGRAIERALGGAGGLARKGGLAGRAVGAARGGAGEAVQEAIEEGTGAVASNLAQRAFVDPNQAIAEGVGESAGLGAIGGFALGAPAGALRRPTLERTPGTGDAGQGGGTPPQDPETRLRSVIEDSKTPPDVRTAAQTELAAMLEAQGRLVGQDFRPDFTVDSSGVATAPGQTLPLLTHDPAGRLPAPDTITVDSQGNAMPGQPTGPIVTGRTSMRLQGGPGMVQPTPRAEPFPGAPAGSLSDAANAVPTPVTPPAPAAPVPGSLSDAAGVTPPGEPEESLVARAKSLAGDGVLPPVKPLAAALGIPVERAAQIRARAAQERKDESLAAGKAKREGLQRPAASSKPEPVQAEPVATLQRPGMPSRAEREQAEDAQVTLERPRQAAPEPAGQPPAPTAKEPEPKPEPQAKKPKRQFTYRVKPSDDGRFIIESDDGGGVVLSRRPQGPALLDQVPPRSFKTEDAARAYMAKKGMTEAAAPTIQEDTTDGTDGAGSAPPAVAGQRDVGADQAGGAVRADAGRDSGQAAPEPAAAPTTAQPAEPKGRDAGAVAAAPVEAAAAEAATSPTNDRPEPTDAQREAGNTKKGHWRAHGLDYTVEYPAGTRRKPDHKPLSHPYGYIKGTKGRDKDHVDVFFGPRADDADAPVFVVDQVRADGTFDEHKVLQGFADEAEARAAYLANYPDGWSGLGAIRAMSMDEFKAWVREPKNTARPAAEASPAAGATAAPTQETSDVRQELEQGQERPRREVPAQEEVAAKSESGHYAAGMAAFAEGKPRTLPSYFTKATGKNPKDWLRGWDAASAESRVKTDKAEVRPYRRPDGSVGYEAVPIEEPVVQITDAQGRVPMSEVFKVQSGSDWKANTISASGGVARFPQRAALGDWTLVIRKYGQPTRFIAVAVAEDGTATIQETIGDEGSPTKRVEPSGITVWPEWADQTLAFLRRVDGSATSAAPVETTAEQAQNTPATPDRGEARQDDSAPEGRSTPVDQALAEGIGPEQLRESEPVRGARRSSERDGRQDGQGVRGSRRATAADRVEQPGVGVRGSDRPLPDAADRAVAGDRADGAADYRPGPGELTREGSWFDTATRNLDLIDLALRIEAEGRPATPEEQAKLAKYVGFGAGPIRNAMFPVPPEYVRRQNPDRLIFPDFVSEARWKPLAERAAALPEAWQRSILQSTQYAHYTSETMVRSIWNAIEAMGFTGGRVLEPGVGIGNFAMLMPEHMARDNGYTGIEFDGPTALIARLLSPRQNMLHADFIKRNLPRDFFDLAVGNPPFSATKILADPDYARYKFMLHDFFFAKSLDRVRPGGLLVFVTSKGTMDKLNDRARKFLADRADLLGAIRLPSTAFEANAGTSVVTDVIFLRKRAEGDAPSGHSWTGVEEVATPDGPVMVNEYFARNPGMVLGQNRISGNVDDKGRRINANGYGGDRYTVVSYHESPAELDAAFRDAAAKLPRNAYSVLQSTPATVREETGRVDFDPKVRREGVVYVAEDGEVMRVANGAGVPLSSDVKLSEKDKAWFRGYVAMRELVQAARAAQFEDGDWKSALAELNKAYDAFRKKFGPVLDFRTQTRKGKDEEGNPVETTIRILKNKRLLAADYDSTIVTALEKVAEDGTIQKSAFLKERTIKKPVEPKVETIGDALAVSLDATGALDIDDVANRLGIERDEAIEALGSQIYEAPGGTWVLADEYLSGDVVTKLDEAIEAARVDERYRRNVDALKDVQPEKLGPSQITAKLGASWIPAEYVNEFAKLIGAGAVTFNQSTESWSVEGGNRRSQRDATAEYGTSDRSPSELLESALNSQPVKIRRQVDKSKTEADPEATAAANEVLKKIKEKFKSWVWTDTARATDLVERYNRQFNNIAPRRFNGDHLTFPGVTMRIKPHPHQRRAVWRQIQTGNTYLAHAVGAGKTFEMIAGAMEQKRLGLIQKPIFVVPNHMLEQFANEFMEFYPLANIMVADDENFHTSRRRQFIAAATLNAPDAIIITHSAFERIGVKEESVAPIRDEMLSHLRDELKDASGDRVHRSRLQQQIESVEQRFEKIIGAKTKDSTITFEDMGVDMVIVDEAHAYRKLDFSTNQQIKGIDPNGSKRAMDLFVKTRILEARRPGRSLVMASGTPVTNTMGELYTIMRFFMPERMEAEGIATFDGWSRQFGEPVSALEANAAGRYEVVERFAKFDNVPELMARVRMFMDVLTSDQLGTLVKRPDIEGGKPNLVMVEPTEALKGYMRTVLLPRLEASKRWKPTRDEPTNPDPVIAITTDGRFAALDPRFVGGSIKAGESTKLIAMAEAIAKEYRETADSVFVREPGKDDTPMPIKGATQVVFYNMGFGAQSQINRGFNARAELVKMLTANGVARDHIAFFDDANTDAKKETIFKRMRAGQIRVLIGSAKKMGTGVNVQNRLSMLHYFDPPWYPSDVEQPHGRIIRQGNQHSSVRINWYATKGTYDATMWQMVARKQRFIDQAMSGDKSVRSMEDMSEASMFEQAAAVASGDPRALQLAGLRQEVDRLERLQRAHASEQVDLSTLLSRLESSVKFGKARIEAYRQAIEAVGGGFMVFDGGKVGNKSYEKHGEFGEAVIEAFNQVAADAAMKPNMKPATIGTMGKVPVVVEQEETLRGKPSGKFILNVMAGDLAVDILTAAQITSDVDAAGLTRRMVNAVNGLDARLRNYREDVAEDEARIKGARKKLGAPFEYQQELAEKIGELRSLEDELRAEGEAEAAAAKAAADGVQFSEAAQDDATDAANLQAPPAPEITAEEAAFENEGGRVLFSLPESGQAGPGVPPDTLRRAIAAQVRGWGTNAPQVRIVGTAAGLPARAKADPRHVGAEGFYDDATGTVYLVAANLSSLGRARQVLAHEAIGHYGIESIVGAEQWSQLEAAVARMATNGRHAALFAEVRRRYGGADRATMTREAIAVMAEKGMRNSVIDRVMAAVRRFLRRLGFDMRLNDADVLDLLRQSAKFIRGSSMAQGAQPAAAAGSFSTRAPTFYSALGEAIETAKGAPRRGDAAAWRGWLDGAQRRGEFKKSERDWLGVDAWLTSQRGPITRDALAAFVRANAVQVQDVVLGAANESVKQAFAERGYDIEFGGEEVDYIDPDGEFISYDQLPGDLQRVADNAATDPDGMPAKYGAHRVPGGENYRELLLTLPNEAASTDFKDIANDLGIVVEPRDGEEWADAFRRQPDDVRERIAAEYEARSNQRPQFRSNHWDQSNVLAHVRFDERTDADGKRVLFLHEIQSDWHQEGRKKGYGKEGMRAIPDGIGGFRVVDSAGNPVFNSGGMEISADTAQEALARATAGVPNAPLKGTDEWAMLAFKRMARYAVDNGFDRIAWVTGEQAADLFDLSKRIGMLTVGRLKDGDFSLSASGPRGGEIPGWTHARRVKADKLDEMVGKELADKIRAGEGGRLDDRTGERAYSGLDLKIGGEGMRGFYDRILPAAVNKWGKRFGIRVGEATINAAESHPNVPRQGKPQKVHAIDVTPAMRDAVAGGLPMFSAPDGSGLEVAELDFDDPILAGLTDAERDSPAGTAFAADLYRILGTDSPFFQEWFGESKVVGKDGRPLPVYHGTAEDFEAFDAGRLGASTAHMTAALGFFFAEDRAKAERYAAKAAQGVPADERVIKAYMAIANPKPMTVDELLAIESAEEARALRERLAAEGHDGIHLADIGQWIAFDPAQVKRVDNRGTFARGDNRMLFSLPDDVAGQSVKPVDLTGRTFGVDPAALWDAANRFYANRLQGQTVTAPDGTVVRFSKLGRGKALSVGRKDVRRMSVVKALAELVKRSPIIERAAHSKALHGAILTAAGAVRIDGTDYAVRLRYQEGQRGETQFYTFAGYEIEPLGAMSEAASAVASAGTQGSPRGSYSVAELADAFNDDRRPLFSVPDPGAVDDAARSAAEGVPDSMVERLRNWLAKLKPGTVLENLRPVWLGALTLRQLGELARTYLPQVRRFAGIVQRMETDRNKLQDVPAKLADRWAKWGKRHRAEADAMAGVMHDATIEGVDPDAEYVPLTFNDPTAKVEPGQPVPTMPATAANLRAFIAKVEAMDKAGKISAAGAGALIEAAEKRVEQERKRQAAYPGLVARFNALPDEAKAIYRDVREAYEAQSQAIEDALVARIEALEIDGRAKQQMVAELRQRFESQRLEGPYFPLARFGDFWISAKDPDGEPAFFMYESIDEWRRAQDDLRERGFRVNKAGRKIENARAVDGVSSGFMADLDALLTEKNVSDKVRDDVYQLYLRALPDLSIRKNFIHRKKIQGYSQDALRAFSGNLFHGAYQIARLKHAHELEGELLEAKRRADALTGDDPESAAKAQAALTELTKRHEWILNPRDSKWANLASSIGFTWYLGVTPAAAIVNLTQTPIVTYPALAARFGAGKAFNALSAAMGRAARNAGGDLTRGLNDEERAAFQTWYDSGAITKTLAHNLAAIGETDTRAYSPNWHRVMNGIAYLFHTAEVVNREATALAAFRLARSDGMGFHEAAQYAEDVIWETHFDYTGANRARWMQSNTAKVLLMFRQYSQNMTWYLWRNFYETFKGASPQARREARGKLVGVLGMTGLFAGAMGMPLMQVMFGLAEAAHAAFGDDDEPFDAEAEFRNFLADMLGPGVARTVAQGPIEALTGAEISSRTSLNELWLRSPDRELEGKALYDYWLEQIAGPAGGIFASGLRGAQLVGEGQVYRGIEASLPKTLKDAMRAVRYTGEGVNTLRGDPVIEDLTLGESLLQLAGFSPARLNERYDANSAIKGYEQGLLRRRQRILNAYAMAVFGEDRDTQRRMLERIREWNGKNPALAIDNRTLRRSLAQRQRYSARAVSGVAIDRRIERQALEQGRFAAGTSG